MQPLTIQAPGAEALARPMRRPGRSLLFVNAAALLFVALFLRVYRLDTIPGINGDEAWSGVQSLRLLGGEPVDWWTPNGNPINFFFIIPLAVLHVVLPPSFLLLRLVSLASGLAALAANYFLCRRAFDGRTAIVSTWLLALLPIDIAYSRFAWDASQSLLATLPIIYLPLIHGRARAARASFSTGATLALAAAVWIHPTNVFAAVFLIMPLVYNNRQWMVRVLRGASIPAKTWTLAGLVALSAVVVFCVWHGLVGAVGRLHGPNELARFAENYLRLFSGATIYEFISGANFATGQDAWFAWLPLACDTALGCAAIGGLWGMVRRLTLRPTACDASLVLAWFTMLAGFFVVAGPGALAPHYERYAICLIAPGALVMARGLTWWLDNCQPHRQAVVAVLTCAAWLWPASFYLGYFEFFERTGGRSHMTFRTAAVEPKLQALRWILDHRKGIEPVRIVCHEWWSYWPLAYLAMGQKNVEVLTWDQWQAADQSPKRLGGEDAWFVEFAGTQSESEALDRLQSQGISVQSEAVYDFGRHQVLSVIGPAEKFSKNY